MRKIIRKKLSKLLNYLQRKRYPNISKSTRMGLKVTVNNPHNLYMEEDTKLMGGYIMNTRASVTFKKYSGAAVGLTIITGNHMSVPGKHHVMVSDKDKDELDIYHEYDKNVVIGEDVWLGVNTTILAGVNVGRGAIVGAGSVLRCDVPPYAMVAGNPAKVVGFRFTPNITLMHEEELYPEEERIPEEILVENYKKYFISNIKNIQNYLNL